MNHMVSTKKILINVILMTLEIKQQSIARELKLSQGQVSKLIAGEQNNPKFNAWVINQVKNILV